jgi:hypothetical protein
MEIDWTAVGVALVALAGTFGGAVLAFRGPSWNDRRIQEAREQRERRCAVRLVALETEQNAIAFSSFIVQAPPGSLVSDIFDLPSCTDTAWTEYRTAIATLVEDEDTWLTVARFYTGREIVRQWAIHASPVKSTKNAVDMLQQASDKAWAAKTRLRSILGGTNAAQDAAESR